MSSNKNLRPRNLFGIRSVISFINREGERLGLQQHNPTYYDPDLRRICCKLGPNGFCRIYQNDNQIDYNIEVAYKIFDHLRSEGLPTSLIDYIIFIVDTGDLDIMFQGGFRYKTTYFKDFFTSF